MLQEFFISETITLLLFCFSGILCVIAAGIGFVCCRNIAKKLITVAPGLQAFLKIMMVLSMIMPLSSIFTSLFCLLGYDFESPVGYHIRVYMGIGCQMIDLSAFVISIDCVVASLAPSQDPLLKRRTHGYFVVIVCVIIGCCVAGAFYLSNYTLAIPFSIFATSMHFLCFLTEVIVLIINIRRHKIVPLTYDLSIRHKLVRNIKLQQLLCPYLFLGTVFSACGPVIFLYAKYYTTTTSRAVFVSLFYFSYNIALLSVIIIFIWKCYKQTSQTHVVIAFIKGGKTSTASDHFQQLRTVWKSQLP